MKILNYKDLKKMMFPDDNETTPDETIEPLIITDKNFNIGYILIITNVAYSMYCIATDNQITDMSANYSEDSIAYARQLKNQNVFINYEEPKNEMNTNHITCPYCGYEDKHCWELGDADDKYECPECSSVLAYQRTATGKYCSQPIKKANTVILN